MTVAHHFGIVDLALRRHRILHRAIALNALVQCPLRVVRGLFADGQVLTHIRRRSGLLRSAGIIRRCNPGLFRHGLLTLSLNLFGALLRGFLLLHLRLLLLLHTFARQRRLFQFARLDLRVHFRLYHLGFCLHHRRRRHYRQRLRRRRRSDRLGVSNLGLVTEAPQ